LFASVCVSTQLAPQSDCPAAQLVTQTPPEHASFVAHFALHAPQLFGSVLVSTHVRPHDRSGLAHPHAPLRHVVPPAHVVPQVPQFALSAFRSTHAAPHAVSPVPHDVAHWPELHT
jgi:hypothetical protein